MAAAAGAAEAMALSKYGAGGAGSIGCQLGGKRRRSPSAAGGGAWRRKRHQMKRRKMKNIGEKLASAKSGALQRRNSWPKYQREMRLAAASGEKREEEENKPLWRRRELRVLAARASAPVESAVENAAARRAAAGRSMKAHQRNGVSKKQLCEYGGVSWYGAENKQWRWAAKRRHLKRR